MYPTTTTLRVQFFEGLKYFRTKNYTLRVLIVVVTTMEKFYKSYVK